MIIAADDLVLHFVQGRTYQFSVCSLHSKTPLLYEIDLRSRNVLEYRPGPFKRGLIRVSNFGIIEPYRFVLPRRAS